MAAAIPVEGDYEVLRQCQVYVLHSPQDRALGLPFRMGQRLVARRWLPRVEAVGLYGNRAKGRWTDAAHMVGYDHGHYWPGREAVQQVCAFLGWLGMRTPPTRAEPEWPLPRREADVERHLQERRLREWLGAAAHWG